MNLKSKIRLFFSLEIIIWLLIITVSIGAIKIHHAKKQGGLKTYQIFIQDVDGLIEGSSVRMMGVPIGYIKTINIVEDHVYIKFVVNDSSVKIPQGTVATVEFNGMAGSKSLELYPPNDISKASGKLLVIKRTRRLGAAIGLFDDMFAKLDSIIVRCNHFSGELSTIMPTRTASEQSKTVNPEQSIRTLNLIIEDISAKKEKIMKMAHPKPIFNFHNTTEEDTILPEGEEDNGQ